MEYVFIILLIGFLIFVHELGHFLAARIAGIPVECFSIGFGPALWKYRSKFTEYRISVIPLGGYLMPRVSDENEFFEIPVYKRIIFSLGGPAANILLAIIFFSIFNIARSGISFSGIMLEPFYQTYTLFSNILFSLSKTLF